MVTRPQKQTPWALWIKNLAETPHLAEIKHLRESKLQHPEPLAHRKLLHATLHWENRWSPAATRHRLQTCLGDIRQTKQVSAKQHTEFPQTTPEINQHSALGRLTPLMQKEKTEQTRNWKLTYRRGGGNTGSAPEKGGGARNWSPHKLSVNKGWKGRKGNSGLLISHYLKYGR
jgi:hypothetical protein